MKVTLVILLIFVGGVLAQRRPQRPELDEASTPSSPRVRGRARFVKTADFEKVSADYEKQTRSDSTVQKRTESRRNRPGNGSGRLYEVEENVDDIPETRRFTKPRVITEDKFEAANAPKTKLFEPVTSEEVPAEELIKSFGSVTKEEPKDAPTRVELPEVIEARDAQTTTSTTAKAEASSIPSTESIEDVREIKKEVLAEASTTARNDGRRTVSRTRGRSGVASTNTETTTTQRSRARTRPSRRGEVANEATTTTSRNEASDGKSRNNFRVGRRKTPAATSTNQETLRGRGPSIIENPEHTEEHPNRTRNGRKASTPTRGRGRDQQETTTTESSRKSESRRTRGRRVETTEPTKEATERTSRRRSNVRLENDGRRTAETTTFASRQQARTEITTEKKPEPTTFSSERVARGRSRSRFTQPAIDETKLEVLPLFEAEPKAPTRKLIRSRGRARNLDHEDFVASSTVENPIRHVAPQTSTSKSVTVSRKVEISSDNVNRITTERKPVIKESVLSEVSEVISSRKVTRRKKVEKKKVELGKSGVESVSGTSRPEVKVEKKEVTEDVDDSDNYPPQFKALLQAKAKELKKFEDSENELIPKSTRPTRRRFSVSTKRTKTEVTKKLPKKVETTTKVHQIEAPLKIRLDQPEFTKPRSPLPTRKAFTRSTVAPPEIVTEKLVAKGKYHARFSLKEEPHQLSGEVQAASTLAPLKRPLPVKPSRTPYNRKSLKATTKALDERKAQRVTKTFDTAPTYFQISSLGAKNNSNRYSARYRSESQRASAPVRASTTVPVYVPTVPTVTPSSANQDVSWSEMEPNHATIHDKIL